MLEPMMNWTRFIVIFGVFGFTKAENYRDIKNAVQVKKKLKNLLNKIFLIFHIYLK